MLLLHAQSPGPKTLTTVWVWNIPWRPSSLELGTHTMKPLRTLWITRVCTQRGFLRTQSLLFPLASRRDGSWLLLSVLSAVAMGTTQWKPRIPSIEPKQTFFSLQVYSKFLGTPSPRCTVPQIHCSQTHYFPCPPLTWLWLRVLSMASFRTTEQK